MTATMRREHADAALMTNEIEQAVKLIGDKLLGAHRQHELRCLLYGLHTLLLAHVAGDEQVYLPILAGGSNPTRSRRAT